MENALRNLRQNSSDFRPIQGLQANKPRTLNSVESPGFLKQGYSGQNGGVGDQT